MLVTPCSQCNFWANGKCPIREKYTEKEKDGDNLKRICRFFLNDPQRQLTLGLARELVKPKVNYVIRLFDNNIDNLDKVLGGVKSNFQNVEVNITFLQQFDLFKPIEELCKKHNLKYIINNIATEADYARIVLAKQLTQEYSIFSDLNHENFIEYEALDDIINNHCRECILIHGKYIIVHNKTFVQLLRSGYSPNQIVDIIKNNKQESIQNAIFTYTDSDNDNL